jgi:hypothetical protein
VCSVPAFLGSSSRNTVRFGRPWCPEDGGSTVLRNVGILPQHYTAPQPRRPRIESRTVCVMHIVVHIFLVPTLNGYLIL